MDFLGVKPKLLVEEGDEVKTGSPLFFNKLRPVVKWASPGTGKIKKIEYGPRRVIKKIELYLIYIYYKPGLYLIFPLFS